MGSRQSALQRALPIVAAAYGEQFGVEVVLSGTDAYTDGKKIVLPMFCENEDLNEVMFGYLAHESAHVRDSDFSVIGLCKNEVEKCYLNIIEDFRIEKLIQEEFPGTQFTLDAMWKHCIEEGMTHASQAEDNEANQLAMFLLHYVQTEGLGREVSRALLEASRKVVEQTFPPGFFVRFDVLMAKNLQQLSNSRDCLRLARDVLKALKQAEEEDRQQQEPQQQSQDQSSQSQDQSQSDSKSSQGQPDPQDGKDSPSGDGSSQSIGSDGSSSTSDSDSSSSNQNSSSVSASTPGDSEQQDSSANKPSLYDQIQKEKDVKKDVIEALRGQLQSAAVADSGQHPEGNFQIGASNIGEQVTNPRGDGESLHGGILASSAIRARLMGLLQAQTRSKEWLHTSGRKMSGKRISRLETGNTRVFIKREEVRRPNTAVHILLDSSGSMNGQQEIANQATVSLALAASSIPKVNIAVSMFPGKEGAVSPVIHRGQPVRPNLSRFAIRSCGATPLADAMLYAARELVTSNSERKVLIIITDGAPDNPGAVTYINRLIAKEVDTYAIGIGTDAVSRFFKQWTVISDVKELQRALFEIAGRFLDLH
jgi:cobaltochelatase CobT